MAETENTTAAQQQYPNLNPYANSNGNSKFQHFDTSPDNRLPDQRSTAMNSSSGQSLTNGPVADKARTEADNTKNELSNLASTRSTPSSTTATGQNLTHYHSFFYNLLNWSNPRATAIAYTCIVLFIFGTRYVPVVRYTLKLMYMILGVTAAAEIAGKSVLGEGFATKCRPKRYYTIPRETLESIMEDLVELGNFFVIEFQRIVFAENVGVTVGAFTTALITYFLIKITPPWGLALLFTSFAFFIPLIYIKNQSLIDEHLSNAQDLLNKQATQVKDLAHKHAGNAMETSQSALKDYSARASEMMGSAKQAAVDKGAVSSDTAAKMPGSASPEMKKEDFPAAPSTEPAATSMHDGATETTQEQEPLLA